MSLAPFSLGRQSVRVSGATYSGSSRKRVCPTSAGKQTQHHTMVRASLYWRIAMDTLVQRVEVNEDKFRELILYIASASAHDPRFGAVKLNKLLFYADFITYAVLGKPITGVEYVKLPHGPAPKMLVPIRDAMAEDNEIRVEERLSYSGGYPQQRIAPLRNANTSLFTRAEIAFVDAVIQMSWKMTGSELSQITHADLPWNVAREEKDTIPYAAMFLSECEVSQEDCKRAEELKEMYGWDV